MQIEPLRSFVQNVNTGSKGFFLIHKQTENPEPTLCTYAATGRKSNFTIKSVLTFRVSRESVSSASFSRSARIRRDTRVRMELEIFASSVFRHDDVWKYRNELKPSLSPTPGVTTAATNPGDLMRRGDVWHRYFTALRVGNGGPIGRECRWVKRTLKCPSIPEKTFPSVSEKKTLFLHLHSPRGYLFRSLGYMGSGWQAVNRSADNCVKKFAYTAARRQTVGRHGDKVKYVAWVGKNNIKKKK